MIQPILTYNSELWGAFVKSYEKEIYLLLAPNRFNTHKNSTFITKSKKNYGSSAYLDLTRKTATRKALVKLRISSHKLWIETWSNERVCNVCNCKTIEDEIHFLLDCSSYSSLRDMFFTKIEPGLPFTRLLVKETLLSQISTQLTSFVSSCFELRDN